MENEKPTDYINSGEFKRDIKEVVWENRIQTFAVILIFFFGVETLRDLSKRK
jgi:hypothetical protein